MLFVSTILPSAVAAPKENYSFSELRKDFKDSVVPLMQKYCLDCHSKEEQEGELDLEQFRGMDEVRMHPMIWVKVVEMMEDGEMPPKKQPQLAPMEREMFLDWIDNYLDTEALANAGDPGRVVARRLSNAEYTYTIQDLTGVELEPVKEFPADGAAGEGFMNVGDAQVGVMDTIASYLLQSKQGTTTQLYGYALHVEVAGTENGKPICYTLTSTHPSSDGSVAGWERLRAYTRSVGIPMSIAAQLILDGQVGAMGVVTPELAFDPEVVFAELEKRMENSREDELEIALEEQRKITRLRLEKLITS